MTGHGYNHADTVPLLYFISLVYFLTNRPANFLITCSRILMFDLFGFFFLYVSIVTVRQIRGGGGWNQYTYLFLSDFNQLQT